MEGYLNDIELSEEVRAGSPFGYFRNHADNKDQREAVLCFGGKNSELFLLSSTL